MSEDVRDKLELKFGRRDLIETLDEIRARVVAGEIEGICVLEISEKGFAPWFAWKNDTSHYWARFTAAIGSTLHDLHTNGLTDS